MIALKENRLVRRLTQAELAYILGVSVATISRWENEHHIPTSLAQKVIQNWINDPAKKEGNE